MASSAVFSRAQEAVNFLRERLDPSLQKPKVAIVCGSGLGGLADAVHEQPRVEIEYSSIPYFPQSTGMSLLCLLGHSVGSFLQGHSPRTCRKVAFRISRSSNTGCSYGWPVTVCLPPFIGKLHLHRVV
jgi:purine nucleoside phosphorylase